MANTLTEKTDDMDTESRMRIFCHYKVGCIRTYHLIATIFVLLTILIMLLEANKKDYRVGQSLGEFVRMGFEIEVF